MGRFLEGLFFNFLILGVSFYAQAQNALPNPGSGILISQSNYPAVVQLHIGSNVVCTATVIGSNVIVTAAHCFNHKNGKAEFLIQNQKYSVMAYSYQQTFNDKIVDIEIGITDRSVNVKPLSVSLEPITSSNFIVLGRGCLSQQLNDYMLKTVSEDNVPGVVGARVLEGYDLFNENKAHFSAVCSGDSGGPSLTFTMDDKFVIGGIHLSSNSMNVSVDLKLDVPEVKKFFGQMIAAHDLKVCGVNEVCQ